MVYRATRKMCDMLSCLRSLFQLLFTPLHTRRVREAFVVMDATGCYLDLEKICQVVKGYQELHFPDIDEYLLLDAVSARDVRKYRRALKSARMHYLLVFVDVGREGCIAHLLPVCEKVVLEHLNRKGMPIGTSIFLEVTAGREEPLAHNSAN